jgi:hypothetical protein
VAVNDLTPATGNLVFHLDEFAPHLGELPGQNLGYLGGGGYGITPEETAAGSDGSLGTGTIPLD